VDPPDRVENGDRPPPSARAGARHRRGRPPPTPTATPPDRAVSDPEPIDDGLREAVTSLPAKQRVAVVLRHALDRPYEEIAVVLDCSELAARANVSAGLKTLRERVG
jgi:DNA-directed RNA polymerase specialized sigma24 family protein